MKRILTAAVALAACTVLAAQSDQAAQKICERKAAEKYKTCLASAKSDKDRASCKDGYKMGIDACTRRPGQGATH